MIQIIFLIIICAALWKALSWLLKRAKINEQQERKRDLEIDQEVVNLKARNDDLESSINNNEQED
jgi:hypothetical protein